MKEVFLFVLGIAVGLYLASTNESISNKVKNLVQSKAK